MIAHLHAPIYVCDAAGILTHFNDEAARLWGYTPEIGKDPWTGPGRVYRLDGSELPLEQQPMAIVLRERRPVPPQEIIIERADGSRRAVRVHPEPLFDAGGNFAGAVNLLLDLGDGMGASYAQGRLAAIVRYSDDAIASKDLDGVITSWNLGAERLFGYTAEEVIGKSITILMPPDRVDEEPAVLARIRRGEPVEHYETVRRRKDGSLVDISLTVSPIYDSAGNIIGASKIARDISDRKRAERAQAEEERRKDEFIATLAHELRNPLAPLKTSLQLMRLKGFNGPVPRSTLEMMERQINHLARLVEDIVDLSRLKQGTIVLRKDMLDLADVVSDALEVANPLIQSRQHQLEVGLPEDTLQVVGDRTRLVQILTNLLHNAAKFTPPRGSIRLTIARSGDRAEIRCADNGPGIPPGMHETIFNMFTTAQPAGIGDSGMGIGLALARNLVQQHGGSIGVRSDGIGKGAEFILRLPLAAATARPVAPPVVEVRSAAAHRILIVDDNRDAAEALACLFKILGHEVKTAHSGQAAITLAHDSKPDVVFLDIGLPDMNGREVATSLRREPWGQSMLLVALTGWGQAGDLPRDSESGFDHHLVKPVELDALVTLLEDAPQVSH